MPSHVELAPRTTRADPFTPSAALVADAGAFAPAIARVWPRPHAAYFAAEPARRHLARLIAGWGAATDARALADALQHWALRRIITAFLPDAPEGLAEIVRKLNDAPWSRADYASLITLLSEGGEGAKTLRHAVQIDAYFVAVLRTLPAQLRRPRLIANVPTTQSAALIARGAKRVCGGRVDDFRGLARLAERLERARSTASLFRMLIEEIGLEQLAPPPVPGADWFKPIATIGQINDAALRFENCLKGRIPLLLLGRAAYYEVLGEEPAIVEIVRDGDGLWVVGEVRGHANAAISDELWTRIRLYLETHGARTRSARPDALAIALAQAAGW